MGQITVDAICFELTAIRLSTSNGICGVPLLEQDCFTKQFHRHRERGRQPALRAILLRKVAEPTPNPLMRAARCESQMLRGGRRHSVRNRPRTEAPARKISHVITRWRGQPAAAISS
ncbi:MAG: hypothetical protein U1E45_10520 [Geminicoccaceae bacterium]